LPLGVGCLRLDTEMSQLIRQHGVSVIVLDPSYEELDDRALEESGGLLLTAATTTDPPRVVLDLSATNYIGSALIELLLRAWKRLSERGGTMVLCGVQPFCADVLRVTRLETLWQTFDTRDQAVEAVLGVAATSDHAGE